MINSICFCIKLEFKNITFLDIFYVYLYNILTCHICQCQSIKTIYVSIYKKELNFICIIIIT